MLFAEGLGSSYLQMADAPQKEEKKPIEYYSEGK